MQWGGRNWFLGGKTSWVLTMACSPSKGHGTQTDPQKICAVKISWWWEVIRKDHERNVKKPELD